MENGRICYLLIRIVLKEIILLKELINVETWETSVWNPIGIL